MSGMTKRERVLAAIGGEELDRPPIAFWHHFRPRGSARALAEATLDFFGRFDLDIFKVMPDLPYPFPPAGIQSADQWHMLTPLSLDTGNFGRQVETVRRVRAAVGPDVPVISTLFSPLSEAVSFAGIERLRAHIQEEPATLHGALAVITDNLARLGRALLDAGADGIFLSVQGTGNGLFTPAQFAEFGRPYDLMLLSAWREGWLNVLHAHAEHDLLVSELVRYPVAVWSWSDRYTGVSLRRMRETLPQDDADGWTARARRHHHGPGRGDRRRGAGRAGADRRYAADRGSRLLSSRRLPRGMAAGRTGRNRAKLRAAGAPGPGSFQPLHNVYTYAITQQRMPHTI